LRAKFRQAGSNKNMSHALVLNLGMRDFSPSALKLFWVVLFSVSIAALLIFYILQVNFLTEETYSLQVSEKKANQLSGENETLKVDFSKLNSLTHIENYLLSQEFEKVGQVKYIRILESSVAASR